MQKKLLASLLFVALSTPGFAGTGPFNGFYANVAVGGENLQVDDDTTVHYFAASNFPALAPDVNLLYPDSPIVTDNSVTGGIGLGYSRVINQLFLVGLEARANFEDLEAGYDYTAQTKSFLSNLSVSSDDSIELENDFSLLVKLGMVVQPRTLIYGLAGPIWGNFETSTDVKASLGGITTKIDGEESEYKVGWLAGLGIEYLITEHISLALEYTHADYDSFDSVEETVPASVPSPVFNSSASFLSVDDDVNAKTDSIVFRFTYYFSASPTQVMKN